MPIVFFSSCFFFYHISPRFIFGVLVPLHKFTPFTVSECFFVCIILIYLLRFNNGFCFVFWYLLVRFFSYKSM